MSWKFFNASGQEKVFEAPPPGGGLNDLLTSDAAGNAAWASPPGAGVQTGAMDFTTPGVDFTIPVGGPTLCGWFATVSSVGKSQEWDIEGHALVIGNTAVWAQVEASLLFDGGTGSVLEAWIAGMATNSGVPYQTLRCRGRMTTDASFTPAAVHFYMQFKGVTAASRALRHGSYYKIFARRVA